MPRQPRIILSQSCYHIMARGNNRNVIFKEDSDFLYFLNLISKYKKECPFDLYHYCLMPNHIHFLIQTKRGKDFSNFMKKLSLSYFHYFRKKYGWVGHFWQNRFKSQPVGKDNYFIQCGKYIELNPVRAKFVQDPGNYPYSSYGYYADNKENNLISEDFFYNELGKSKEEKQLTYKGIIIDKMVLGAYNKSVWGSARQKYSENKKLRRKLVKKNKNG